MDTIALNSSQSIEMWLNGNCIYDSDIVKSLWYGVKFVGDSPTGIRTGNLELHKSLPIQSLMRGCIIRNNANDNEGLVGYLDATDWTKWEDGTTRTVTDGEQVMVEIPEFYLQFIRNNEEDSDEIRISLYPLDGFVKSKKMYVSAYEAYNDSGVLMSVVGQLPTVSITRAVEQQYARANGSAHWNIYTYTAHKAITWLFVVEYANRNCQDTFNSALTAEGYHQGGLGSGVTDGTVTVGGIVTYSFVPTGTTDSLGNSTGVVSYTTTTADEGTNNVTVQVPRYRGIENPFGHIWKNIIDVIYSSDDDIYLCEDYNKFGNDKTQYKLLDVTEPTTNGYVTQLTNNAAGDLFPTVVNGSSNRYYCDYQYNTTTTSDRTLLIGGRSNNEANAGLFYLYSYLDLSSPNVTVGSRLTYLI